MKNLNNYFIMHRNKSIRNLARVTCMIMAAAILYGCANEEVDSISKSEPLSFEKQLVITDESGNNSITLNISVDDESLLANYTKDNYELIINAEPAQETAKGESTLDFEKSEPISFQNEIKAIKVAAKVAVVDLDFKDAVNNYSLVSKPSSDEAEVEGINFCRWFPRDYQYELIEEYFATSIKTTFGRTKKTCNNIEYHIAAYGSSTPFKSYQLKHPGDEETTSASGTGMSVYYRYKKNTVVTYTWYY